MSIKNFKVGKFNIEGNTLGENPNVALAVNIDMSDRTRIGDTWRRLGALGKAYTINVTCKYNSADAAQNAMRTEWYTGDCEIGSVRMYEDLTHYFIGTACILTNFNITKSVGADDELTMTFEGSGKLTYT